MLVLLMKGAKRPVGSVSPSGKSKKVREGRWIAVSSHRELPKYVTDAVKVSSTWTNVHYAKDRNARMLVRGEDSKGRMQYLYNEKGMPSSAKEKFARINALNKVYDSLVAENAKNARKRHCEAECLSLILDTAIRPGSEKETLAEEDAFGATTLEGSHVVVDGGAVRLEFVGKKGVKQALAVTSEDVVKMLVRRKKASGDHGRIFSTTGDRLLLYTKRLGNNAGFQSKDFRTHIGTILAMKAMSQVKSPTTMKEYKGAVMAVAEVVSGKLGNEPKTALSSYINPAIFERWRRKIATT